MKRITKIKTILLITVGILFALSPIITSNLNFTEGNKDKSSGHSEDITLDKENLKISKISERIHIDNNWTDAETEGICTGSGNYTHPYIIEDLVIDGENSGPCILIENSDVYFIIRNCTAYNSGTGYEYFGGIRLSYITNGQLINNNCSFNDQGIFLWHSSNNTISGNTLYDNIDQGLYLFVDCYDNTISGNTANNNNYYGIQLSYSCENNLISGNTANNNGGDGIHLYIDCYDNTISGNTANNNNYYGIQLSISCDNNLISGNTANNNGGDGIHLYDSNNQTVSGNTANYNQYGIYLEKSNYTIVSGNQFSGNDKCWVELNCEGNVFEDNDCVAGVPAIPGYGMFFLIGIIGIIGILLKRLKQSKT